MRITNVFRYVGVITLLIPFAYTVEVFSKVEEYIYDLTRDKNASSQIMEKVKSLDPNVLLQMLDASSKVPDGIRAGNFFGMGNFDECYSIRSESEDYGTYYGKYCLAFIPFTTLLPNSVQFDTNLSEHRQSLRVHAEPRLIGLGNPYVGFHLGVCLPSFLDVDEFLSLKIQNRFCYSKATEPELSTWAITSIAILSVFLCVVIFSTVYDTFLHYSEKKPSNELLIAFSFLSNGRKLFASSSNPEQLLCLNGIKAISMMWVIVGHVYSLGLDAPVSNFFDVKDWLDDTVNMFVFGATVSVDTFFTVGGLVTVYTFMKAVEKGVKFNIILYYVHRFLRLTPAFAITAMVYANLLNYMGNGPLWNIVNVVIVDQCKTGWWGSLLYISNYLQRGSCVPQSWYLQVDMQLFALSPLVLIPLSKWRKLGLGLLGILSVLGVIIPAVVSSIYKFTLTDMPNYYAYYYLQTHARFGPYVIGMIVGYVIFAVKKTQARVLSPILVCLLWIVSLAGLVACLYAGHDVQISTTYEKWNTIFFLGFNRQSWSVALSIMIFLCVTGYGGPVNSFLSIPIFQFLSKMSYSMYLVHYAVITIRYASSKELLRFSNVALLHSFWGDFMFTIAISVFLCLTFESPIIIIEKHIFGRGPKRTTPVEKKAEV